MMSNPTKKQLYRQVEAIAEAYCQEMEYSSDLGHELIEMEKENDRLLKELEVLRKAYDIMAERLAEYKKKVGENELEIIVDDIYEDV